MSTFEHSETQVSLMGSCRIPSPIKLSNCEGDGICDYVTDEDRVLFNPTLSNFRHHITNGTEPLSFEKAGPREFLYFEPTKTKVGIVTCGGLCPGLNNVIRSLVMQLHYRYGVSKIIGFKYGYEGLAAKFQHPYVELTPTEVEYIHLYGGTILGSSRGDQKPSDMVDTLERLNINILFCIGGDGTLKGAEAIRDEVTKRGLHIIIGGIPKTIDNDIGMIERSFGFETAFSIANDIIRNAHNEAIGARNGIALIKLMGRDSGFIAANAALSIQEVNFVLIPEMHFELEGENGFLAILKKRLETRNHALIVIAEGAGQDLLKKCPLKKDVSGNIIHGDIGLFLKEKIIEKFSKENICVNLKYIDPSYIIRSAPANPNDSKFCSQLAQNAVHAAMAGRTGFVAGNWNNQFTVVPIPLAVEKRKKIDLESELWYNVLEATGQPVKMYD